MPARSSSSTLASICSTRQLGSCRRSSPSVQACGSWRRAVRRFTSRMKSASPSRRSALPLSISSSSVRGLAELVSILERRAAFLRDSPASDPGGTALQALVDWSYDLLHGDEKTLLQQLAVHRGGASLTSLAAVAATRGLNNATVAYLVAALVDKSIVSASFMGGAARYDMLDTVREYVLERLDEAGALVAARQAHAAYFATLAEAARTGLRRPEWLEWMKRLELEHDNFWAALTYAREAPDPLVAARLGVGLGWYFGAARARGRPRRGGPPRVRRVGG